MSKTWKPNELTYLKRYAPTKTLAELAQRFECSTDDLRAQLVELDLATKDGAGSGVDPDVEAFEAAIEAFNGKKWATAAKAFEALAESSELPAVAQRARRYLAICEDRRANDSGDLDGDPFVVAVYRKNRGDYVEALEECLGRGRKSDPRFLFLAASIHAIEGRHDEAASLLTQAIEADSTYRVHAFHDGDFDELRARIRSTQSFSP